MTMSSIKKWVLEPFDLLGLANFVSAIASPLLILSWKVLATRPSAPDITAQSLKKIKRPSTDTRLNHMPWLPEKESAYPGYPRNPIMTYSIVQETCPHYCFIAVLNISIESFLMAKSRQFCCFHFTSVKALDGLLVPLFIYSTVTRKPAYTGPSLTGKKIQLYLDILCSN